MIRILFFLVITVLFSCTQSTSESLSAQSKETTPLKAEEYYANGQMKHKGSFDEKGKKDGAWTVWYETGIMMLESGYKNGLRHGKTTSYFQNGFKRFEGKYRQDKKVGVWYFYNEDGGVEKKVDFDKNPEKDKGN